MSEYKILTDSTGDLPADLVNSMQVDVLPLKFRINDTEYSDTPNHEAISLKEFYDFQRAKAPTSTSAINPEDIYNSVKSYFEEDKDVLYITFSSALSVTYQNAKLAAENLKKDFPNNNFYVIDSLCASFGQGLLVYLAYQKKAEGLGITELCTWVEGNKKSICHWFTVNDLFHLMRGGRVSKATALFGSMLSIKPVMHVDDDGTLQNVLKVRGRRQSLDELVKKIVETAIDIKNQTVFLSHGDVLEDAKYLEEQIKKICKPKKIIINYIGPVIGSHTGAGVIAVFFVGGPR